MPTPRGTQQVERELLRLCHSGLDADSLRQAVLPTLRRAMPVDAAFFATADPDTLLFTDARAEEPLGGATDLFLANEFGGGDVNRFAALATSPTRVASLDQATRRDRWASDRYRRIMRPLGLGDELRAALVADGECWGFLCLHRTDHPLGFAPAEIALISRLAPHLGGGLRQAVRLARPRGVVHADEPGVVVLTDEFEVVAVTPEAQHLLGLLPHAPGRNVPLPASVTAVAAALQAVERGASFRPPSVRAAGAGGGWVHVHASRLSGPSGERHISVVLTPARPADTVPLLLAAHGLTAREAEVTRLVLRGASTRTIVETLRISPYTVQDHLKAVFDKVGVRSRRDLAGRLMGQP